MDFPVNVDTLIYLEPIVLLLLCLMLAGLPKGPEKFTAIWALINVLIHIWLEGTVCLMRRGPKLLVAKYDTFDTRYTDWQSTAMALVWIELFFHGPMCILWYYAILKKRWYKPYVAIINSSTYVYGTGVYVFSEYLDGFKHIIMDSWPPSFSSQNDIVNFWILFVFASSVYIVYSLIVVFRSIRELSSGRNEKKSA